MIYIRRIEGGIFYYINIFVYIYIYMYIYVYEYIYIVSKYVSTSQ